MTTAADQYRALVARLEAIQENTGVMAPPSVPEIPPQGGAGAADECAGSNNQHMPPKAHGPGLAGDEEPLFGGDMKGGPQVSIRSLIAALQAIEQGTQGAEPQHQHGDIELFGMDEVQDGGFGDASTTPDAEIGDVGCVTKTGTDLASKGREALKRNGGGNPMQESLARKLSAHYEALKSR